MWTIQEKTFHRQKITVSVLIMVFCFVALFGRLVYLCVFRAEHYDALATDLHERERSIKAARGRILDRNGQILADNKTVCTVSVIYNQVKDKEKVIAVLSKELSLDEKAVRKKVEKYSAIERIKSNVDKEIGDRIREMNLPGVKVDEDFKRFYPYGTLASKVLGFTGADNQGIIGLEVSYDSYMEGIPGMILTMTDAKGIEVDEQGERRIEPINGDDLCITLDRNIQTYASQLARQVRLSKEAECVYILVMNPKNGEIYACVNEPEFDLNHPYELPTEDMLKTELSQENKQDLLNQMWRNGCINDTYEPGSTFKVITAAAGLEEGVVVPGSTFSCPGFIVVDDRKIRCHKVGGHGAEDFVHATMNSCNPVFVTVGLRLGVDNYYRYFEQFGLRKKTGVDLPGEANTIMHKKENCKNVELATVSFGQSFQITPIQLLTTVSAIINGGYRVTPHLAMKTMDKEGNTKKEFEYPEGRRILSEQTSETMREILEKVVSEGGGKNGQVTGYRIGVKTATSQTLPRGSGRYIASFIGFAPADDPEVIAIAIIHNPKGTYYGGQIAAPVVRQLFENILPYLGIKEYNQ